MPFINIFLCICNVFCGVVMIVLALPLKNGRVKMNKLYGMRTRAAFSSEENWYKINAYGARLMIRWAAVIVVIGLACLFLPLEGNDGLVVALAFAPLLVLVPCVQIYRYGNSLL